MREFARVEMPGRWQKAQSRKHKACACDKSTRTQMALLLFKVQILAFSF